MEIFGRYRVVFECSDLDSLVRLIFRYCCRFFGFDVCVGLSVVGVGFTCGIDLSRSL